MKRTLVLALIFACAAVVSAAPQPPPEYWVTEGPLAGLQLNGHARAHDGFVRLTESSGWQAGSAFSDLVSVDKFDVTFSFRFSETYKEADGIAFCVQNDPRGFRAIGAPGGFMGYGKSEWWKIGGIENGIAVEFDSYQNCEFSDSDKDHIGIDINGSPVSVAAADLPFELVGQVINAEIVYDGTNLIVYAWPQGGEEPSMPTLVYQVDLPATLQSPSGYIGFTGATATYYQCQDILAYERR